MTEIIHLPDDAGEYADGLTKILNRIPEGWGKWIRLEKGWYPIIVELDEEIAKIFPDYEVYQAKEKFGGLRYYCSHGGHQDIIQLIRTAEARASITCERCGNPASLRENRNWIQTLCDECEEDN